MVYHELEQWTWAQDIFSNANINKHKNDNQFSEHFSQKLPSQNTRNVISEDQDFKFFWGSTPPDLSIVCSPLRQSPDTLVINISQFYIVKSLDSLVIYIRLLYGEQEWVCCTTWKLQSFTHFTVLSVKTAA